ncbi:MAG: hypothetical protein OEW84_01295 [Aigarchaeota archaeon]|nr:hypothetical protein [Aigarchaeota archaeon]
MAKLTAVALVMLVMGAGKVLGCPLRNEERIAKSHSLDCSHGKARLF